MLSPIKYVRTKTKPLQIICTSQSNKDFRQYENALNHVWYYIEKPYTMTIKLLIASWACA